ncbi:MAG: branched-chain amino acid ABC transporter permease [Alphaproteobacteria bacterium]
MTRGIRLFGPWALLALLMLGLPTLFDSSFALTVLSLMGVFIIFSCAYNMLLGQGGLLSFGHAVYFGIAGYCTIHLINAVEDEAIWFPLTLLPLIGGLVGLVLGVLIGFVSTRRAGTTFAMISLGFGELFTAMTLVLLTFFNGEDGVQGNRVYEPRPLGISFGPEIEVYYLIAIWTFIATAAMYALTRTPFGRVSNAVRDNPERLEFIGYSTHRVRWLAFALSSFFAGLAGALHAINYEHVGFETVGVQTSGLVLFMTYIGGIGSFLGPIVGAVLISYLNASLSDLTEAWFLYLGLVFVLTVMFAPAGLAGLITMHEPLMRVDRSLLRRLALPYLAAIATTLLIAAGAIGLIEMVYHLTSDLAFDSKTTVFWIELDTEAPWPWIGFAVLLGAGLLAARRTYPQVSRIWDATVAEARARLLG